MNRAMRPVAWVDPQASALLSPCGRLLSEPTPGRHGDRAIECWGRNGHNKLGLGQVGAALVPAPVAGAERFVKLAVGGQFTCGLTADGQAWCWGDSQTVGDGAGVDRDVPTAVGGGHGFVDLSAGYGHVCGLTGEGTAWCWGAVWMLGSGSETPVRLPVAVAGGHRFRTLATGGTATCAITTAGTPMCWGINGQGAVGQSNVDP